MNRMSLLLLSVVVASCVQLPPTAADIEAKKFDAVADKAVIYVVRPPVDSTHPGQLVVDTGQTVATMSGTYHRLEVSPGRRYIDGTYPPGPRLTFDAEAGKVYFLRYTVRGGRNPTGGNLQRVGDQEGRALVAQATLFP